MSVCLSVCGLSWFPVSLYVVYADGRVCISILHAPGDDPMGYECVSVCGLSWFSVSLCVVYADGRVCISILHAPGDDPMGYESSSERWSPVQSVEKILLSVVSMLAGKSPCLGLYGCLIDIMGSVQWAHLVALSPTRMLLAAVCPCRLFDIFSM